MALDIDVTSLKVPLNDFELQKQWKTLKTSWTQSTSSTSSSSCSSSAPSAPSTHSNPDVLSVGLHQIQLRYLLHVGIDNLRQIWKVEVGNLGEVIRALDSVCSSLSPSSSSSASSKSHLPPSSSSSASSTSHLSPVAADDSLSPCSSGQETKVDDALIGLSPLNEPKSDLLSTVSSILDVVKSSKRYDLSIQFLAEAEKAAFERIVQCVTEASADI